jgi:plastocyanin
MRSHFRSAAFAAVMLGLVVAPSGTGAPAAPAVTVTHVTVKMTEYHFALSVKKVPTGTVVFTVVNSGQIPHIFEIQKLHKQTPLMQAGRRYVMRVTFKKPGKYYYLCPVGAHVQYGMFGTLPVVAAAA